jgi:hypothetical protein
MRLSPKLARLLDRLYEPLSILLNLGLIVTGVWLHATWGHWLNVVIASLTMVILGILDFFLKRIHGKAKLRITHERYINELLSAAAFSILRAASPPLDHVRANLMLPDDYGKQLTIAYKHGFDFDDKDLNIRVPIGTGSAGQAFLQRDAMVADATLLSRDGQSVHWGLPHDQVELVRPPLKSIFSIPVRYKGSPEPRAILNIDSDNTIDDMRFNDESIQKIGYCFARTLEGMLDEIY